MVLVHNLCQQCFGPKINGKLLHNHEITFHITHRGMGPPWWVNTSPPPPRPRAGGRWVKEREHGSRLCNNGPNPTSLSWIRQDQLLLISSLSNEIMLLVVAFLLPKKYGPLLNRHLPPPPMPVFFRFVCNCEVSNKVTFLSLNFCSK